MSDYLHCWEPTDYPRKCPECGGRTGFRPPNRSWNYGLIGAFVLLPLNFLPFVLFGPTIDVRIPGVAAFTVAMVALLLVYRACGGVVLGRDGFALCAACGWLRSGEDSGPVLRRLRRRGERLFLGIALGLIPPVAFYSLASCMGRSGAGQFAVPLIWLFCWAGMAHASFRPRRFPPEPKARR